jgi:hypothetical protein
MSKMAEVLAEIHPDCRGIAGLMVNRRLNMTAGWRPSDAARAEREAHQRQGCAEYRRQYEGGRA